MLLTSCLRPSDRYKLLQLPATFQILGPDFHWIFIFPRKTPWDDDLRKLPMRSTNSGFLNSLGRAAGISMLAGYLLTSQTAGYRVYAGSTHAHTMYTWSHGEQFAKNDCSGIQVYARNPASTD